MRMRLAAIALILLHLAVSVFVIITVIEVWPTAVSIIRQIQNQHDMILIGTLLVAFIPLAFVSFWGYKVILVEIRRLSTMWQLLLTSRRESSAQSNTKG
jgi:hypothetical protein